VLGYRQRLVIPWPTRRAGLPGGVGGWVLAGALPDQPRQAPVWRWDGGPASTSEVTRLARVLGLAGNQSRHSHGWLLSASGGELWVRDGDGHPWAFARSDVRACPPFGLDIDHLGAVAAVGCAVATAPGPPSPAPGPDAATARTAAAPLLAALGVSGPGQVSVGSPWSTLSVAPAVGGLPTSGDDTTVIVDAAGVRAATGRLHTPRASDSYPLRSARDAFTVLANEPRPMIAQYCGPLPGSGAPEEGRSSSGPTLVPSTQPIPPTTPGSPPAAAPTRVCRTPQPSRVTGAQLGLILSYDASHGGSDVLVPAWLFAVAGTNEPVPVIAIAPTYLAAPTTGPSTASSSPGAQSGASTGSTGGAPAPMPGRPPRPPAALPGSTRQGLDPLLPRR